MIKVQLEGVLINVGRIERTSRNSNFFRQVIILHQPEEDYKGHTVAEEFYVIHILSNSETDSRFVKQELKGTLQKLSAYLKGERWVSGHRGEYNYSHKLNLIEWQR